MTVKILVLSDRPPQGLKSADAYETRLAGLRVGLEANGAQTDLLSLRTLRVRGPHLLFWLNAREIARRARGYDAIHAAGAGAAVAAAAAKLFNRHLAIFDVHGDELMETRLEYQARPSLRGLYRVIQSAILTALARRLADRLLMVSGPFYERYRARGVPPDKMIIVRNGVDSTQFTPVPPRDDGLLRFVYAGSFQAWQAMDVLLEAMAQNTDDQVRFHLIGFGPRDQALKAEFAARLGERVTLEDRVPASELPPKLAAADVLLIPRTRHPAMQGGLPSKFAEYLAMGRPLIVTDVDETATFVRDYGCGLVCPPTVEGFTAALRQAAAWTADERRVMGENARRLAETVLDWRVIAGAYVKALQEKH